MEMVGKALRKGIGTVALLAALTFVPGTTVLAEGIGVADAGEDGFLTVYAEADAESCVTGNILGGTYVALLEEREAWTKVSAGTLTGWVASEKVIAAEVTVEDALAMNQQLIAQFMEALGPLEEEQRTALLDVLQQQATLNFAEAGEEPPAEGLSGGISGNSVDGAEAAEEAAEAAQFEALKQSVLAAVGATEEDLRMLASIIYCESAYEPYPGKVAVGSVVMNRMYSPRQPNTIAEVIYAEGQFSPVGNGSFRQAMEGGLADASCYQAALEALAGSRPVGDCLYFRRANGRDGIVIGNHVFY